MSNLNVPTNTTCCDGDEAFARNEVDVALTVVSLMVFGLCSLIFVFSFFFGICRREAFLDAEEDVTSQESEEERIRKRKESILNGLIVKEWVPDDPTVESTEGSEDTLPSGEAIEAPKLNSSPTSCVMLGSDDCESIAGEEEMAGCAICLSHFKPQQLVCESNNASCQHVFHKDCMVNWLVMKHHDNCPMCREVYLIKTV
jgi:hypothetical protein